MSLRLVSSKAAALVAAAYLASASASEPQQQACQAEDGRCHSSVAEDEFGAGLSLLMTGAGSKGRDRVAGAEATGTNGTAATCNEMRFQGLCYRTCTDMGEMEPRHSPSNCGGVNNYNFIQRCEEDGSFTAGSGSAPGLSGRPMGGCFGDESALEVSPDAPNMCTMDCKDGAPSTSVSGNERALCCADGKSTPQAIRLEEELVCSCSLGKTPPFRWMPEPMGVLRTPISTPCNTVCNDASAWLMHDNIAYCCPENKKPTVNRKLSGLDYTTQCSCEA